jgi:hypothetical protein
MSSTDRQSRVIATEDWKKIYQSFSNADFQSYDFDNLRRTMINYLRQNYPEDFNDYIESSEYLALIDLIAFLGQNLSFRIDLNARENFLETAERRESVLRLAKLISYNPKRNKAASGLLKFETVSTTENLIDSTGKNLRGSTVLWNDRANPNYFEQFVKIINAALPNAEGVGSPTITANIEGVVTEQYRFNALNTDIPVFGFSKPVEGVNTRFEIVSTGIENETIVEEAPLPGNNPAFVYRDDSQGAGSSNTGFFMHFKQGQLENASFSTGNPVPNQIVGIDDTNINNSDIWLYSVDSNNFESALWKKLESVEGNNIIYNSLFKDTKDVYAVSTRSDDRINLVFSDGVFGNLPTGNFRTYYRTSDNRNMVINPSSLQSITIQIPYISKNNAQETLTIGLSLKNTVSNGRPSETSEDIKQNAPASYYTQNRLVTAEDYNIGPLGIDQDIIKTKTVNRISSGISRYFDLTDPTGKYSTTSLFASDGVLYRQEYLENFNFSFTTQSDIEGIIYSQVERRIASTSVQNYYNENFDKVNTTDLNAVWRQTTSKTNRSTGYFEQILDLAEIFTSANGNQAASSVYSVGTYTTNALKNIKTGAMCKFTAPEGYHFMKNGKLMLGTADHEGSSDYVWTTVKSIDADGTVVDDDGFGPIVFNDVIPNGAILNQILPKYSTAIVDDVKKQIIDRAFAYKDFALRFDQTSSEWKLITSDNLNTYAPFSLQRQGDISRSNQDNSWVFYFQTDGQTFNVSYRNLRYVFESDSEVRFFFDSADKVYDTKTGKIAQDKITILNINTKPNSLGAFNKDFDWSISDAYKDSEGYNDTRRVQLAFYDSDDDGISDNPELFKEIVDETGFIFQKKYSSVDGVQDYKYFDNSDGIVKVRQNDALDPINVNAEVDGQVFYIVDFDLFKVLNKAQNNMTITDEYRAFIGRAGLKFHYVHVADSNYRIDPASSNILDTYVLTKDYDTQVRKYVNGGITSLPLPPSSDELFRNYGASINQIKSISDEVVFHPVTYKMLFGEKADSRLQVTFKVVKNKGVAVNNNQLKSTIVQLINQFFAIENWDFGDTFYFQELSSYIMNNLSPDLSSIVVVPKQANQVFGSLFEIKSESNEIFLNAATVNDIEIIDEHTATNLQASGLVVTSISSTMQGVQTRSTNAPTTLPSSSATTTVVQNTGAAIVTGANDATSVTYNPIGNNVANNNDEGSNY